MRKAIFFLLFAATSVVAQQPFRIAMIGCHRQFEPAPALVRYLEARPDLCLWIGDNVYADTWDDFSYLEKCYEALAQKPAFRLLRNLPTIATWDDHDYGYNDAGKEYPLKEQSKAYFRNFWGLEAKIPADQDGIYYSHYLQVGTQTVQMIMLDVRYNRDTPYTHGDVLGEQQWQWLEKELLQPADLRFIASGFQILLGPDTGSETWAAFPEARERLFETVRKSAAQRVLFLTGDQHYGEVCRMKGVLDYDAVELQFAGVNQIESPEYNPWRVAPVIKSLHSYALLDLYLEETPTEVPHVLFQIFDAQTNALELTYRVNLREIETQVDIRGAARFVGQTDIALSHPFPALDLRISTDGSDPAFNSEVAPQKLQIASTTTLRAALFHPDGTRRSPVFENTFTRLDPVRSVAAPKDAQPGLFYQYYEKQLSRLDELKQLSPLREGRIATGDYLDLSHRPDSFAFVFTGYLYVAQEGAYTLLLRSDDGARVYLHDQLVVDNDGSHSARTREGLMALEAGWHPIKVEYFDDYSGEKLQIVLRDQSGNNSKLLPNNFVHQK